jgi:hypothetical protein
MQTNNTSIDKIYRSAKTLAVQEKELNEDIARAAITCAQTGDYALMQELFQAIPNDHPFKGMVSQMCRIMDGEDAVMDHQGVRELKEEIRAWIEDITDIAFDIGGESRARMDVAGILLRYLPEDKILDFLLEFENHHRDCVNNGENYGPVPDDSDIFARLTSLRLRAAEI